MKTLLEIKKQRRKLGLTQKELAQAANVSQSLIAKIEADTIKPSHENVLKIITALETIQKKQEPTAKEFMITKLTSCKPTERLKTIIAKMKKYNISQIPVVEEKVIIGLITESDLLEHVFDKDITKLAARHVMQSAPPQVTPDTPESAILPLLRHFPLVLVMDKGKIKGAITKADIIQTTW